MRLLEIALFAALAANVTAAQAQYGLYGSPEMLPANQNGAVQANYPSTDAGPILPAYSQQPVQPQYVAPVQQYAYPVNARPATTTYQPPAGWSYPAAPTTAYQPYQPGAHYRYPAPTNRQTMPTRRVAALQPIPAPPAAPAGQAFHPYEPAPAPTPAMQPVPQGSGMMNQMLADQACANAANCGGCAPEGECFAPECSPWYASASALVLGRSEGRRVWTSYVAGREVDQLTNTQFDLSWRWGGEVTVGRRICCGCQPLAIEATYWSAQPFSGHTSTTVPGGYVSTPLDLNSLYFGREFAGNWFNGAQEQCLYRRDEFHNIEVNLVRQQLPIDCDMPWDIGWSVGVRYFRFQDFLGFDSLAYSATGWDDLANTAYLSDRMTNNLIGAQLGFEVGYQVCDRLRAFVAPTFGLFDNYMQSKFEAATGDGRMGHGPYAYFPVNASRNGVSFLTQIDLGLDWQFAERWSAKAGYRVVAVTGVGMADDQFPQYICDTPEIEHVANSSSLVLHGAFFGLTYSF